ncbi:hypothetical protein M2158_005375 [Streptomyces sp. SAI-144]|uniref:hypothetical protein n=1 Tax=unclassified Streptomyces TaxID=2593676 RepID=UPI002475EE3F|nr:MULTISPECIES: hypothetical protein [unclassified Streptomyces]MDH6436834.1 hypothetical protein [Streptomyces sp. SAI-144]MDH6484199.1 hypothetical protein [Streptomyces sp. SAI-127]
MHPGPPAAARPAGQRPTVPSPQIAPLLRSGPFHEALRAAISASGLSLERIQDRLRRMGMEISLASLSSWQSGRYRPERPRSLEALRALELLLAVPDGGLLSLLGPPRPRGRWLPAGRGRRALEDVWPRNAKHALGDVETRWDAHLTRISTHSRIELDAFSRVSRKWTRQLLRADRDGPDRKVTLYQADGPGAPPEIHVSPPCRPGAVVTRSDSGLFAAELLFERPLAQGETIIVEYTLEFPSPRPHTTFVEATLHVPMREYVLQARFDPAALPTSCHSYRVNEESTFPTERLLRLDAAGSVHAVALETGPCRFGIRWTHDESPPLPSLPRTP